MACWIGWRLMTLVRRCSRAFVLRLFPLEPPAGRRRWCGPAGPSGWHCALGAGRLQHAPSACLRSARLPLPPPQWPSHFFRTRLPRPSGWGGGVPPMQPASRRGLLRCAQSGPPTSRRDGPCRRASAGCLFVSITERDTVAQLRKRPRAWAPMVPAPPTRACAQAGLDEAAAQLRGAAAVVDGDPATTENRIIVLTGAGCVGAVLASAVASHHPCPAFQALCCPAGCFTPLFLLQTLPPPRPLPVPPQTRSPTRGRSMRRGCWRASRPPPPTASTARSRVGARWRRAGVAGFPWWGDYGQAGWGSAMRSGQLLLAAGRPGRRRARLRLPCKCRLPSDPRAPFAPSLALPPACLARRGPGLQFGAGGEDPEVPGRQLPVGALPG